MKDLLNNLPPFYIGQKVICMAVNGNWRDSVGNKSKFPYHNQRLSIRQLTKIENDNWEIFFNEQTSLEGYELFNYDGTINFKPLEEQNFPLIKLSQIKENEKQKTELQKILIEN